MSYPDDSVSGKDGQESVRATCPPASPRCLACLQRPCATAGGFGPVCFVCKRMFVPADTTMCAVVRSCRRRIG